MMEYLGDSRFSHSYNALRPAGVLPMTAQTTTFCQDREWPGTVSEYHFLAAITIMHGMAIFAFPLYTRIRSYGKIANSKERRAQKKNN
jgi:hypothetical protein